MSDEKKRERERTAALVKAGFAVGIGSAAIAAALLYASRSRKPKTAPRTAPPATD